MALLGYNQHLHLCYLSVDHGLFLLAYDNQSTAAPRLARRNGSQGPGVVEHLQTLSIQGVAWVPLQLSARFSAVHLQATVGYRLQVRKLQHTTM